MDTSKKVQQTSETLYQRYLAGETLQAIATTNGVSRERVRQLIQRYEQEHGLQPHKQAKQHSQRMQAARSMVATPPKNHAGRKVDDQTAKRWYELAKAGVTEAQIAKQSGYTQMTVWKTITEQRQAENRALIEMAKIIREEK